MEMYKLIEQREYHRTGATYPIEFRIKQLKTLYQAVLEYQDDICAALYKDLGKCAEESYMTEIGMVLAEIRTAIRNLPKWSRDELVAMPITQFLSSGRIIREPYGVCLIISPWNYPLLLTLAPLVSAISAGNCVVVKPSELSPSTSKVIEKLLTTCFEERYCKVVLGGADVAEAELKKPYDMIFFTGSPRVGRIVMEHAARNLTPVVLELGGKSPCIVDKTANIKLAARRIMWGKLINAGQTCIAPDYLLVHSDVKDELMFEMQKAVFDFYGQDALNCPFYPKIISKKHFERLIAMINQKNVIFGGAYDSDLLKIEPVAVEVTNLSDTIMIEEIFGPILPVIAFNSLDSVIDFVAKRPKPLALYLFTRSRENEYKITRSLSFGGGCINDTISHITSSKLPFGGIGESGMGSYHGRYGYEAFSHKKSLLRKAYFPDVSLRYHPLKEKIAIIKRFLK